MGSIWQLATSLSQNYETTAFALMVAACEALKPPGSDYRDHNACQVVEALLGKTHADFLKEHSIRAQDVRNALLHAGEFRGPEFVERLLMSTFQDPTFDQARRELACITPKAMIAWLRLGGTFSITETNRRRTWRPRLRDNAVLVALVPFIAGMPLGAMHYIFLR